VAGSSSSTSLVTAGERVMKLTTMHATSEFGLRTKQL
jgi:hypothetical protein